MLIVVDYTGTLVQNARFTPAQCFNILMEAKCLGVPIIIWTGDPESVLAIFRGAADEVCSKPEMPAAVKRAGGWSKALLVDDDAQLLHAARYWGATTLPAANIDELIVALREAA